MITCQGYSVTDPDALETPAMLLFQDELDHNIRSVCEIVGGGGNLITHVKTHKSEAVNTPRPSSSSVSDKILLSAHCLSFEDKA
jgi:hypothetical protein